MGEEHLVDIFFVSPFDMLSWLENERDRDTVPVECSQS